MQLQQLIYFKFTADSQSVAEASKLLFIPASTLYSSIHVLEGELKTELFYRVGRKLIPTEVGYSVLAYVNKLLSQYQAMQQDLQGAEGNPDIRICSSIPSIAAKFTKYSVMTNQNIYATSRDERLYQFLLESNVFDITIGTEYIASDDIISFKILTDYLWMSVPKNHLLAKKNMIVAGDLRGETIIQTSHPEGSPIYSRFLKEIDISGVSPVFISQGTSDACARLAINSDYIFPMSSLDRHTWELGKDRRFVLYNFSQGVRSDYYLSYLKDSKVAKSKIDYLSKWLKYGCKNVNRKD